MEGERSYREWCENERGIEPEGTAEALAQCATMLEVYGPECWPANAEGQVAFARSMADCTAREIRAFLARTRPAPTSDAVREALVEARDSLIGNTAIIVGGKNREQAQAAGERLNATIAKITAALSADSTTDAALERAATKAEFNVGTYGDGSGPVLRVHYDAKSERCPDNIWIDGGDHSSQWVAFSAEHADALIVAIQQAARALKGQQP